MNSPLVKLIKADVNRRSRFHDLKGNFAGFWALVGMPKHVLNWGLARAGRYRTLPWIPENARRAIEEILSPDSVIVECGAGMSTLWWASRAAKVRSFESNYDWYSTLKREIQSRRLTNASVIYAEAYDTLLGNEVRNADLVIIDGVDRERCVRAVLDGARRPIWVYLDNSDRAATDSSMRRAEELLCSAATANSRRFYTGFAPGQLAPSQGLLVRLQCNG